MIRELFIFIFILMSSFCYSQSSINVDLNYSFSTKPPKGYRISYCIVENNDTLANNDVQDNERNINVTVTRKSDRSQIKIYTTNIAPSGYEVRQNPFIYTIQNRGEIIHVYKRSANDNVVTRPLFIKNRYNINCGRIALLIGNSKYEYIDVPLIKAKSNLDSMRNILSLDFDIIYCDNCDSNAIKEGFARFFNELPKYKTSVIYFTGYSMFSNSKIYLCGSEAKIGTSHFNDSYDTSAISLNALIGNAYSFRKNDTDFLFLDAAVTDSDMLNYPPVLPVFRNLACIFHWNKADYLSSNDNRGRIYLLMAKVYKINGNEYSNKEYENSAFSHCLFNLIRNGKYYQQASIQLGGYLIEKYIEMYGNNEVQKKYILNISTKNMFNYVKFRFRVPISEIVISNKTPVAGPYSPPIPPLPPPRVGPTPNGDSSNGEFDGHSVSVGDYKPEMVDQLSKANVLLLRTNRQYRDSLDEFAIGVYELYEEYLVGYQLSALGYYHYRNGDKNLAISYLKKAIAIDNNSSAMDKMGNIFVDEYLERHESRFIDSAIIYFNNAEQFGSLQVHISRLRICNNRDVLPEVFYNERESMQNIEQAILKGAIMCRADIDLLIRLGSKNRIKIPKAIRKIISQNKIQNYVCN